MLPPAARPAGDGRRGADRGRLRRRGAGGRRRDGRARRGCEGAVLPALGAEPVRAVTERQPGGAPRRRARRSRRGRRRGRLGRWYAVARAGLPGQVPPPAHGAGAQLLQDPWPRPAAGRHRRSGRRGRPARRASLPRSGVEQPAGAVDPARPAHRPRVAGAGGGVPAHLRGAHLHDERRPRPARRARAGPRRHQRLGAGRRAGAALLHLASSGVRAASGDPFWISTPQKAHIRLTTASIREGYDDLADVVAEAARASTWAGHR